MKKSLHQMKGVLSFAAILTISVFANIGSEKLSQIVDVKKKVAEQLGINEKDLWLNVMDHREQYGAGLARCFEEVFLVVWNLNTGEIVYTTRRKNRYPIALTWVGQKLVYMAYDGVTFSYELDPPFTKPIKCKVFLADIITRQDKELKIPCGGNNVIYSCDDDTIILTYPLRYPPDYTTCIVWYSVTNEIKIQEWIVNVGQNFGIWGHDAHLFYCTPDHKRIWVVTYIDGPKLPFTGYVPAPVPVLAVVNERGTRILMDPTKEWLYQWSRGWSLLRLLKRGREEVIAAVTVKWLKRWEDMEFYLVHFSPEKEIWRRWLDVRRVKTNGFRDFNFIWINQNGQKILCQEFKGEKRLFWWDVTNYQIEIIAQDKEFRPYWFSSSKIWLKEIFDEKLLKIE